MNWTIVIMIYFSETFGVISILNIHSWNQSFCHFYRFLLYLQLFVKTRIFWRDELDRRKREFLRAWFEFWRWIGERIVVYLKREQKIKEGGWKMLWYTKFWTWFLNWNSILFVIKLKLEPFKPFLIAYIGRKLNQ